MRLAIAALCFLLLPLPAESVDFSTLSGFDWTEGMELPAEVTKLDGKKITIVGFIRTEDGSTEDIEVFWLVDQGCDCEGSPKMNEIILCELPEGTTIENDDSPIEVTGTLSVGEEKEDGYIVSLYRLQVESVQ